MKKIIATVHTNKGMTLVEVLISVFILSIAITASLAYFTTAKKATQLARDTTVATSHAEYILEDMHTSATLADITASDWDAFAAAQGLNTLNSEIITVAYADPDADPLNITVTVDWVTNTRAQSINLVTELTK